MKYFIHLPTFIATIVICSIIFIVFIFVRLETIRDHRFKKHNKRRFMGCAKTGDILTVAYSSKRAKLVNVFTGSVWAHSALVIKAKNRKPYVVEVMQYSKDETGLIATKLKKWMRRNKHYTLAYRPYQGIGFNMEKIKECIAMNEKAKMDMFVVNWLKTMYKVPFGTLTKTKHKKRYYCSEFVAHLLQETQVLHKKYKPAGYKPWELLYGKLPLLDKHYYGEAKILE